MPNKKLYLDCLNHVLDYRIYNSSENSKFSCLIIIVHKQITIKLYDRSRYYIILFENDVSENVMTCDSFKFSLLQMNKTVETCMHVFLPFGFIFITPSPGLYFNN